MKEKNKQWGFINSIKNRQFQKLFMKNWLQVFICIALPLIICAFIIQYFSSQSLLREIDAAALRSTSNTKATLETLLDEVCATLDREITDESVLNFFETKHTVPPNYGFITLINTVQKRIDADYRQGLYYSIDTYSAVNDFVVSTFYKGQSYAYIKDKSLIDNYFTCMEENPDGVFFAASRVVEDTTSKRLITIYRTRVVDVLKNAFVSISVDCDKLIQYITENYEGKQGMYLILDTNNQVILDTSNQMNGQVVSFIEENTDDYAAITKINGRVMRSFWIDMERFGWKCVQLVSMEELQHSSIQLQWIVLLIVLIGIIAGMFLSYRTTRKMFRPIEAILKILENPTQQSFVEDESDEIRYLLIQILELFHKNITLENQMINRAQALRKARAKALQEQMSPHFLNNVLQVINWMAIEENGNVEGRTSQAIVLLADIIRIGKEQKSNLTTVQKEIDYTKKFVELQCLRYGTNIQCKYIIESAVQQMLIPCISLQTLVENSIVHGFATRGYGTVYVTIRKNEQKGLYICVEDDGTGMSQGVVDNLFKQLQQEFFYIGEHLGLINLFQRFNLIYEEKCKFDIRTSAYGGACIEIITPGISEELMSV